MIPGFRRSRVRSSLFPAALVALLACCSSDDPPPPTFSVGGVVSGLGGTGLVLQLNGGTGLPIGADGDFSFPERLANGASYDVEVVSSPPGETCSVSMGVGTIQGADVTGFTIGTQPSLASSFVGTLDDFRLYDRALSQAEIMALAERQEIHKPF